MPHGPSNQKKKSQNCPVEAVHKKGGGVEWETGEGGHAKNNDATVTAALNAIGRYTGLGLCTLANEPSESMFRKNTPNPV